MNRNRGQADGWADGRRGSLAAYRVRDTLSELNVKLQRAQWGAVELLSTDGDTEAIAADLTSE